MRSKKNKIRQVTFWNSPAISHSCNLTVSDSDHCTTFRAKSTRNKHRKWERKKQMPLIAYSTFFHTLYQCRLPSVYRYQYYKIHCLLQQPQHFRLHGENFCKLHWRTVKTNSPNCISFILHGHCSLQDNH